MEREITQEITIEKPDGTNEEVTLVNSFMIGEEGPKIVILTKSEPAGEGMTLLYLSIVEESAPGSGVFVLKGVPEGTWETIKEVLNGRIKREYSGNLYVLNLNGNIQGSLEEDTKRFALQNDGLSLLSETTGLKDISNPATVEEAKPEETVGFNPEGVVATIDPNVVYKAEEEMNGAFVNPPSVGDVKIGNPEEQQPEAGASFDSAPVGADGFHTEGAVAGEPEQPTKEEESIEYALQNFVKSEASPVIPPQTPFDEPSFTQPGSEQKSDATDNRREEGLGVIIPFPKGQVNRDQSFEATDLNDLKNEIEQIKERLSDLEEETTRLNARIEEIKKLIEPEQDMHTPQSGIIGEDNNTEVLRKEMAEITRKLDEIYNEMGRLETQLKQAIDKLDVLSKQTMAENSERSIPEKLYESFDGEMPPSDVPSGDVKYDFGQPTQPAAGSYADGVYSYRQF